MVKMINPNYILKKISKGKRPLFWGWGTLVIDQNLIWTQTFNKYNREEVGWFMYASGVFL
jgi:hypothetical protein